MRKFSHHNPDKNYGSLSSHKKWAAKRSNRKQIRESINRGRFVILAFIDRALSK